MMNCRWITNYTPRSLQLIVPSIAVVLLVHAPYQVDVYRQLQEEACIGAGLLGEQDYLGNPRGIVAYNDHIYILDESVPTIGVYGFNGHYSYSIGRVGEGPGEYLSPNGIGISELDGTLFVRESSLNRIITYSSEGDYLDSIHLVAGSNTGIGSAQGFKITNDLTPYFHKRIVEVNPRSSTGFDFRYSMLRGRADGSISDTLIVPEFNEESYQITVFHSDGAQRFVDIPFGPKTVWALTYSGSIIAGYSEEYRIEIHAQDGTVHELSRDIPPVPISRAERRWYEQVIRNEMEAIDTSWTWDGPRIPRNKPFFTALIPDRSGRVWVLRQGLGIEEMEGWEDTLLFDVFDEYTGRYLGEVAAPQGLKANPEPYIKQNTFIAYLTDESEAPLVKRYRLIEP